MTKEKQDNSETAAKKFGDSAKKSSDDIVKRRSRWQSSLASLRYVYSVGQDEGVKVRDSDKATAWALLIVTLLVPITMTLPHLAQHRLPFVLSADVLVGAVLIMYLTNRLGIITTLTPRQAKLCWQIMMGGVFWGVYLCLNLTLIILLLISSNNYISVTH